MEIRFKRLTTETADDFFSFFDYDAFSDHQEWAGCYCLESHLTKEEDEGCTDKKERRRKAEELIREGIMTGYLLYDGDKVVGWCNVGDKEDFRPICKNKAFFTGDNERGKIKVLYCIDIAPNYRGMGIVNQIFEKALSDAKEEGYLYFEGYPLSDTKEPYQYKGPIRLYEKYGFETYGKLDEVYIMRKEL